MQICLLLQSAIVILREPQAIVTFFGSVSGVDFGKTMLKTPFAIDALISSFLTPCGNDKFLENLP